MYDLQKREKPAREKAPKPLDAVLRSMAGLPANAGARDPVSQVQDTFSTSFQAHGRAMMQLREGQSPPQGLAPHEGEEEAQEARPALPTGGIEERYAPSEAEYQRGHFLHRYADVAFNRGDLAAGILQGESKMVLISTMKQALGESPADNQREEKLWGSRSSSKRLLGGDARLGYNKGEVRSAVSLTIDSIASGRNAIEDLKDGLKLARKTRGGSETLKRLYPFLTVEEDKETLAHIRAQLRGLSGPEAAEQKRMLAHGERKMQALIEKKEAMELRFMQMIEELSANALGAEREFQAEGFSEQIFRALYAYAPEQMLAEEEPPPDPRDGEDGAEDDEFNPFAGFDPFG